MKKLTDITCKRCGYTSSLLWLAASEVDGGHTCPDGVRYNEFEYSTRVVPGPGERLSDKEKP